MGYLKKHYGLTLMPTAKGTCPECGVVHRPDMPHNPYSMAYQYKFYDKHGRWPKWVDAMAHCPDEVKAVWIQELKKRGVEVNG